MWGRTTTVTLHLPDPSGACDITGVLVEAGEAAEALCAAPPDLLPTGGGPDSIAAWAHAARVLLELIARGRFVPAAHDGDRPQSVRLQWVPLLDRTADRRRRLQLVECLPGAAWCAAPDTGPAAALDAFWADACDSIVRRSATAVLLRPGWECDFAEALGTPPGLSWDLDTPTLHAEVRRWLEPPELTETWIPVVRLLAATHGQPFRLVVTIRSQEDPRKVFDADWVRRNGNTAQRAALAIGLEQIKQWRPGDVDLDTTEEVDLDLDDTWAFLSTVGDPPFGVALEAPQHLTPGRARDRLRLRLLAGDDTTSGTGTEPGDGTSGSTPPRSLGHTLLEDLRDQTLRWEVRLDGELLDAAAVEALMASPHPLVQIGDEWLALDEAEFVQLRRHLDDGPPKMGPGELIAAVLAGQIAIDDALGVEVVASGEVARVAHALRGRELVERAAPADFAGELRGYQARGLDWLSWLGEEDLGGCLADDMGLGKTIEAIALLLADPGPTLVVCPTSVLGNWDRELRRFAPTLDVVRHYGPQRPQTTAAFAETVGARTIIVTTYALIRRDIEVLDSLDWHRIVLDEAQHVKNPSSETARAARRLGAHARNRLAMTGTPVENHLGELWSILDFANPGLLGSETSFRRRFANPIQRDADPAARAALRRLTAPFVLRRRKSDPTIVPDLPDKHETTLNCDLTTAQASLYAATVDSTFGQISAATGIQRRGLVLALLTRLKQICDHPGLVDGKMDGADRSGKLAHLLDVIEDVREAGDKSLVFTQYVEMGHLLARVLGDVPFLHGGVRQAKRDEMVASFQDDPAGPDVLVVSLRAGGLGLNLTAATRVFHFDRWWNPAVEDQATDRTHRIGQTRDVWVHKMVCLGTVEERIDALLDAKRGLADSVIGEGEGWLTELSDTELAALVRLETST